jgi:NADH dehydrogenase
VNLENPPDDAKPPALETQLDVPGAPPPVDVATGLVPARRIGIVGEIAFCGAEVAAAIAKIGLTPRVLCPDQASQKQLERALPAGGYELVEGDLGSASNVLTTLDGTYAAAFVSPIAMSGRLYRADTHLDDVKRFIAAAEKSALRSVVYHSSVAARKLAGSRTLREAAQAEELIHGSRCTEFRLSTGPLMGLNDGFLSTLVARAKSGSPFMGIMGYGGAEFQPLYVGDFAQCVARLFDEKDPIPPGVYGVTGPETTTWLELVDRALALASGFKFKFHAPMFAAKLYAALSGRTRHARLAEEAELAGERFALEKSDTERFLGKTTLTTCAEIQKRLMAAG